MGTTTSRIGLYKADPVGEVIDVEEQLNDPMDKIDASIGWVICTSTTRPPAPWPGMPIYETDTKNGYVWDDVTDFWEHSFGPGVEVPITWIAPPNNYKASDLRQPFKIVRKGRFREMAGQVINVSTIASFSAFNFYSFASLPVGDRPASAEAVHAPSAITVSSVSTTFGRVVVEGTGNLAWQPTTAYGGPTIAAGNFQVDAGFARWEAKQ